MIIVTAVVFAIIHIIVVAIPVLLSGGSGESQAFAAAIFDLPIFWLLGLFPGGRGVLYGSSPSIYMLVFAVGGTFMYAAIGALVGWGMHIISRVFRAA
jgi:hypothetical protein